jgi:altronate dehydratase
MKAALVISDRDNVATALQRLEPGLVLELRGAAVTVVESVPPGHKISLRRIGAGEAVIKYGSPIGTASADIPAGAHVHTHNVASGRGRGDLDSPPASPQSRLAEPTDETGAGPAGGSARLPETES